MSAYFYETFTPFVKYIWTLFENTFTSYSDRVKHHVRGQTNTRIFSYLKTFFWHEHVAFQRSVFGQLTAGILFIFSPVFSPRSPPSFFSSVATFYHRKSAQKTYLSKVGRSAQKHRGRHLSRPFRPFWGPLVAILDFAGGAAVQAVSKCPLRR